MTDTRQDRHGHGDYERRALAALKRSEPVPVPDEVRERLRRTFMTGRRQAGPDSAALPGPAGAVARRAGWSRRVWIAASVAAAAAVVILARAGLEPVGAWRVSEAIAPEGIRWPGGAPRGVGVSVEPGMIRVGPGSEWELGFGSRLRLRVLAGTDAAIPASPGRWFGRERTVRVQAGEIFGATRGPLGFRLRFATPEAEALLSGTSFAVIRNEDATCFCLYRGRMEITSRRDRRPSYFRSSTAC